MYRNKTNEYLLALTFAVTSAEYSVTISLLSFYVSYRIS